MIYQTNSPAGQAVAAGAEMCQIDSGPQLSGYDVPLNKFEHIFYENYTAHNCWL